MINDASLYNRINHLIGAKVIIVAVFFVCASGWADTRDLTSNIISTSTPYSASNRLINQVVPANDGGTYGVGQIIPEGVSAWQGWLFKVDALGNVQWEQIIGDGLEDTRMIGIVPLSSGDLILVGYTGINQLGTIQRKVSASGDSIWQQSYGVLSHPNSVVPTNDGGTLIVGNTQSPSEYDPDGWILKTDEIGDVEWEHQFVDGSGGGGDDLKSVIETSSGDYLAVGYVGTSPGSDGWAVRVNSDGIVEWSNTYGGTENDYFQDVCLGSDGGFLLAGTAGLSGSGLEDGWVISIGSSGGERWSTSYGGTESDYYQGIQKTQSGYYLLAGYRNSGSAGYEDCWVTKITREGDIIWDGIYGTSSSSDKLYGILEASPGSFVTWGEYDNQVILIELIEASRHDVPGDYATIQSGIDAAVDGDTILVQPGTYIENINFNGKNIVAGSGFITTSDTSYISTTIIDGDSLDHVVVLENLDEGALLSGFTIQNGYPHLNAWPANGGGGIYVENSIGSGPSITDCIISNNHTGDYGIGGGLFINSPASLRNCTITGNTSMDGGGGLAVNGGSYSFSFDNLQITNNYTQSFGGGLYSEWVNLELNNCIISDNIAYLQGGGIHYNSGGDLTLTNVVIQGNSVERDPGNGGALHASGSSININFSTIVNNASTSRDEIVTMSGTLNVTNSIVWSASDSAFIGFYSHGEIGSISNSIIQGGPSAVLHTVNNEINTEYILDLDPQFINPSAGDYHLLPGSPCIGFGTALSQPTTDILGNPRPDPSGTNPDIGAYESPFAWPPQDPDQTLVAYYPFNGNANDESGNGFGGDTTGHAPQLVPDRFGNENSAYWFDGLDDYIDLGDHFDTINHLTIALWVNFDSLCFGEQDCGIIQKWVAGDWSQKSFSLAKEGDGSAPTYSDEVISRYFSGEIDEFVEARTNVLVEDQWYFLTTTFTDSMVEMYVDGILVDMVESTLVINDTNTPVYVGNNYSGSNPFHGRIDDIRIYSRALSPDEILALYNPSQVQVSLPSMTASVGDTVVVPLQVNLPVNQTFDSAELQFTGYQSGLQYLDIDLTGSILEGLDWSIAENETDTLLFTAYAGSQEISGSGVLCNLRFVVTGVLCATVPIEISHAVFNTMIIENITNGSIHIQPVPVYGDVDGNGVIQAHDAALILKHTVGVDTLYCQEVVNADVDTNGVLSALDASNVLRYVVQLIDSLPVSGTSPDLLAQGSISLDDQGAVAGGTLDFPVYLNNGSNILSFQGELSFDASKLSPADNFITWSGEMDNFSVETDLQNGHLKFAAAGANPDGQNAVIAMLHFNVSGDFSLNESTTISIDNIKLNENIEYSDISAQVMSVTSVNNQPGLPQEYSLSPNYPNPFNPSTTIKYGLPEAAQVRLTIYDIRGAEVIDLVNQSQSPGWYESTWNGRDANGNLVGTGIYLVRIQVGKFTQTRKIVFLK